MDRIGQGLAGGQGVAASRPPGPVSVSAPAGSPAARIAPITVTPIVPPIERKNWVALVAAPSERAGDGVLDHEHQVLEQQAEPEAKHDRRHQRGARRGTGVERAEQEEADGDHHRPGEQCPAVAAGARDHLPRDRRW